MSTIISKNIQIGRSNTPSENFTLAVPTTPDGTLKLSRGNSGATISDILTVDASGVISSGGNAFEKMKLETAKFTTSGTAIDFTSIPSWVKKITVMLNGVSTSGTSTPIIQLGTSSGIATSGYTSDQVGINNVTGQSSTTTGHGLIQAGSTAAYTFIGNVTFVLHATNTWVATGMCRYSAGGAICFSTSSIALSGTLDRLRLTTVNGTDTFDAGTVNILLEGY